MVEVHIWCDGSGQTDATPGGWAYVAKCKGHVKECNGGALRATNNQMELMAAIRALEDLTMPCKVHMTTDSQYVCHAFMHDWIAGWKRKKWRGVKNAELWHRLLKAVERHHVVWNWTKGHAGQVENERCDVLAGEARRDIALAERDGTLIHLPFEIMDLHTAEQLSLV
jgi:ribonuclease HI